MHPSLVLGEPLPYSPPNQTLLGGEFGPPRNDRDIGKTVCTYEYMRQKDNMGRWEPYRLLGGKVIRQDLCSPGPPTTHQRSDKSKKGIVFVTFQTKF